MNNASRTASKRPGTELAPALPTALTAAPARGMSRRSLLAGLGIGSLGLVAGSQLLGCEKASAATPAAIAPTAKKKPARRRPKPVRVRDANGNLVQPGPFVVQASCDLVDDQFLTDDVMIGADDEIVPYVNPATGNVEAIVVTNGGIGWLTHNPSTVSGWQYSTLSFGMDKVVDAAVSATSAGLVLAIAFAPGTVNGKQVQNMAMLDLAKSTPTNLATISMGQIPVLAGPISAGTMASGTPYFYGWSHQVASKNDDYVFMMWGVAGSTAVTSYLPVVTLQYPQSQAAKISEAVLLEHAQVGSATKDLLVVHLESNNGSSIETYQLNTANGTWLGTVSAQVSTLVSAYATSANTSGKPAVAWQTTDGALHFVDETGAQANLYSGASTGDGQVVSWLLGGEYTFVVNDSSTATVISQFGSGSTSGFTQGVPIVPNVQRFYGAPADKTEGTLFAVDLDGTLSAFTKSTQYGWTQNVVHQDGATLQSVPSWSVQIDLTDANGSPLLAGSVQLTADRPVAFWQASTSTVMEPGQPITLQAGPTGMIDFSVPTSELDCAIFTAQALDASGNPSGNPLTITPNIDVQRYLAGTGTLISTGPNTFSGASLTGAQNPDGSAVFPSLSASDATAAAGAISHVASIGLNPTAPVGTVQATMYDPTNGTFQTSSNPNAFTLQASQGKLRGPADWWITAAHDAESVYHGLRHGAIEVSKVVTTWHADASQWEVQFLVQVGGNPGNFMSYVITDIKSAVHAISAFFKALGADIVKIWNWLKRLVGDLIKQAEAGAKVMEAWFDQLGTQMTTMLNEAEKAVDNFFTNAQTTVNDKLDDLLKSVTGQTVGDTAPQSDPTTDTGSSNGGGFKVVEDVLKFLNDNPALWLYRKIRSHIPEIVKDGGPDFSNVDVSKLEADLDGDFTDAWELFQDIYTTLTTALKDMADANSLHATQLTTLVGDVQQTADKALQLADELTDTVLDLLEVVVEALGDFMTYEFPAVPLIGELLEWVGIDITISIRHVITLITAYPTALINELAYGGGPMFPDQVDPSSVARPGLQSTDKDPWGVALNWPSAVIQLIWTVNDFILDGMSFSRADYPGKGPQFRGNALTVGIDIAAPLLLLILQWPSVGFSGNKTAYPFHGGIDQSLDNGAWTIASVIISFLAPATQLVGTTLGPSTLSVNGANLVGDYGVPIVGTWCGLAGTVCGGVQNGVTHQWLGLSEAIIGNLSYDMSWAGLQQLEKDWWCQIGKLVVDTIGNVGAVACFIAGAIKADVG